MKAYRDAAQLSPAIWTGAVAVVVLVIVGLLNLSNAGAAAVERFHQTQVLWVVLSLLAAAAVAVVDMRFFEQLAGLFYWIGIALLVLVLPFGKEVNHAHRWFAIGDFASFQPSEFMKPALVLYLSRFFHGERNPERYTLRALLKPLGYVLLPVALIMMEPDLGTSLVVIAVGFSVMFFQGIRLRSFLILLGIILLTVPLAWEFDVIQPYQKQRVYTWLHMSGAAENVKVSADRTMQPEQALWAVGSGRLLGKGTEDAIQSRMRRLPEAHTDYIIASFAEQRGFLGCVLLLGLYAALTLSLLVLAVRARERFGVLVSVGAVAIVFWQVVFNIGMVLGIFPVVGLTLPFLSYGGSSMLSSMLAVGLALNSGLHRGQV
ncbi:MAG: rod shape-determining protein RodA [Deltaproteobacteria bacterium]|nr:rod shape-determining protein RodA [Deltaproteobacteria bacterium]